MTDTVIIVTGQTATGKTSLAVKLAREYNGELINCDSRQIYKYLDVITGKDYQQLTKVKIWLYDVVKPNEHFSSFDFVKLAIPSLKKIIAKGKTPVIVGGTYLYLRHLLYGVATENIPPNWKLRKKLENKSVEELQKILKSANPFFFSNLSQSERNNPHRLIRKIEIVTNVSINRLIDTYSKKSRNKSDFTLNKKLGIKNLKIEIIGLKFKNKESLRKTIEKRVEERLKLGAVNEVKKLLKMGYSESDPGLKTIGYQQLLSHLKGVIDIDTAIQQWITKEIQYAKRQYTFMKKDKNIRWKEI